MICRNTAVLLWRYYGLSAIECRAASLHGGGTVTARVGSLGDGCYVEDGGPGIPAGNRERVFEHGFATRTGGTGYDLSVVRSIVGAREWDLLVADVESGGARFAITDRVRRRSVASNPAPTSIRPSNVARG